MDFKFNIPKLNLFQFILLLLIACPIMGQAQQKKLLTELDYEKWGILGINNISNDGKWTSYTMTYENSLDTLFLQSTKTKLQYAFPKGYNGRFGDNIIFAYQSNTDLTIVSLHDGKRKVLHDVKQYELLNNRKHLLVWYTTDVLEVRTLNGEIIDMISDVSQYTMNEKGNALLYVRNTNNNYESGVISFENYNHTIIAVSESNFVRIQWQKYDKSVLLFDGSILYYYRFLDKKLFKLLSEQLTELNLKFALGPSGRMKISSDGRMVFFNLGKDITQPENKAGVEIWNGNDSPLLPVKQILASDKIAKTAVWFPDDGTFKVLTDDGLSKIRLSGLQDYAVLSNPHSYSLNPKYYEDVDYYIKNVRTGTERILVKQQSHDPNQLCFSPLSNVLLYYRDKNWWLYNLENDVLKNLTQSITTNWDNTDDNVPSQFGTHGVAGWSVDGKSVLLYDVNDIWKISLDGKSYSRLTNGKEQQKVYRISRTESESIPIRAFEGEQRVVLDLNKNIILTVVSPVNWSTGYVIYNPKSGLNPLVYESNYVSGIKKSINNCYVYSSQNFVMAPQLSFINLKTSDSKILYQSNKQQTNYFYGKSELIHYKDSSGNTLRGALYYPADYDISKKYPMIVHIYEQQSKDVFRYRNPTNYNSEGFNVTNFTLNGYFVLLPDIHYKLGNPAGSAQDCVTAAVRFLVATGKVDDKKIGLIGHSFGGYETNFILTQSDLFAAAVSGSGVSDTIGYYFGLSTNNAHMNEFWRFESQQFRMGSSFYQNKDDYIRNSPLNEADKIKTPLLLWAGKKDKVIPFDQSITFYLALRRLRYQTILLEYPSEGHSLQSRQNQKDLTTRILKWFDYFLKDKKEASWITVGVLND